MYTPEELRIATFNTAIEEHDVNNPVWYKKLEELFDEDLIIAGTNLEGYVSLGAYVQQDDLPMKIQLQFARNVSLILQNGFQYLPEESLMDAVRYMEAIYERKIAHLKCKLHE